MVLFCCAGALSAATEPCYADGLYHVNGLNIPAHSLSITEQVNMTQSDDDATPDKQSSTYIFDTSWGPFKLGYSRYLNNPAQYSGRHGASVNSDMGLGISGYQWNWYQGNTLRVKVDGKDIIAQQDAATILWHSDGTIGWWCGLWKHEKMSMWVRIVVIDTVAAALVEVEIDGIAESIEVILTCYPGGFGPAYGIPSMRSVEVDQQTIQVSTGQPARQLQMPKGASAVFYSDRWFEDRGIYSKGACGLCFQGEALSNATINVSSYGVTTHLFLPKGTRAVRFALTGYDVPNKLAREQFHESTSEMTRLLETTQFIMERKQ